MVFVVVIVIKGWFSCFLHIYNNNDKKKITDLRLGGKFKRSDVDCGILIIFPKRDFFPISQIEEPTGCKKT